MCINKIVASVIILNHIASLNKSPQIYGHILAIIKVSNYWISSIINPLVDRLLFFNNFNYI